MRKSEVRWPRFKPLLLSHVAWREMCVKVTGFVAWQSTSNVMSALPMRKLQVSYVNALD